MPADAHEVTVDAVLGGRLLLEQPRHGHRVGHDAILLAAACPARAGDGVLDLGAGAGGAGLALAVRVAGVRVDLVEIDAGLAAMARANARRNGVADRVGVHVLDAAAPAQAFASAGLEPGSTARVMMNPPFNDPTRQRTSPVRRLAHAGSAATLAAWVASAHRLLRLRGTLTLIWRAEGIADVLRVLEPGLGGLAVLPVHGKAGQPAIRILVQGTKGSRAPLRLLPGLALADKQGRPTAAAQAVLRDACPLVLDGAG
jgi:tRNA1(Val) A37 N6-methylase TrmN6